MTKENLESIQMMKIAGRRANLYSTDNHEFSELVWENGQVYVQSLPRKSQESSSFANANILKKRFGTLDESLHDKKSDSLQENKIHESLYQTHFNTFLEHNEGNACDNNLTDSQIVPVNEYANMQVGGSHNLREIPQFDSTRTNQPHDQSSLQQYCYQAAALFKTPRVLDASTNQVLVGESPNSKLQEQDLEYDGKREKVNFSLFLRSPVLPDKGNSGTQRNDFTVPTNRTSSSSRSKKLKNNGCGNTNVEVAPLTQTPKKSVPDGESEAVSRKCTAKKKLINTEKSMEPRSVASSSFCSRGASNNPIYNNYLKRRNHEDTEGSADLSDPNVEERLENARKQVPARGSAGFKRKRIAEVHNQSERKRRDKINNKMRALQELIPNCNKVDKASMLDEAIEYLKTLQLQVQMMSMGTGVCMPQMMIPTGMQQIHAPQMANFSPTGMRMHMGGALGCSPYQFLISPIAAVTAMAGITQNRIQIPGFTPQPLPPMLLFRSPLGLFPVAAAPVELMGAAKLSDPNDPNQKINYFQERTNAKAECAKIQPSI